MNFDDLKQTWNAPVNQWPVEGQQLLARRFANEMTRRRRFQAVWLSWTFLALAGATFVAVRALATGRVNLGLEWPLIPLLVLPWAFAFRFLRCFLRDGSPASSGALSVADSLCATLKANRSEQRRLKCVGLLFLLMAPVLILAMRQLHLTGKASLSELHSMAVLFGSVLLLSSAGMVIRFLARLRPQQRQLESVLAEITQAETN